MLKKRRFILFLFIALLGVVLAISFLWEDKESVAAYKKRIELRISKVIDEFDEDYLNLLMYNRPDQQVTFQSLTFPSHYPFYLFSESGELLFWSDNEMIPTFDDFKRNRKFQLIENTKGTYLTQLRKFNRNGKGYWMVQVYSLYDNLEIKNEFLNSGPNPRIFGNDRFVLSTEPQEGYSDIDRSNGEYLFSILFRVGYANIGQETNQPVVVFFVSLLGLVLIIGGDFVITIWRKGRRSASIVYTVVILLSVRAIMVIFNFPQSFSSMDLFDPSQYASSVLSPSLGDLLLNVACCLIVVIMVLGELGNKSLLIRFSNFRKGHHQWIGLIVVYLISTALMVLFFGLFSNIVNNSQWNLNILSVPSFDKFKAISLFIIFLAGAGYLSFTIIGLNLLFYNNTSGKVEALKVLVLYSLPIVIFLGFKDLVYLIPFLAHVILLTVIITFRLYSNLFKLSMDTFLTFFFGCLVGSIITGAAAYQNFQKEEIQTKLKFAQQVLLKEDVMAEFFISDVMDKVADDIFIKKRLTDPLLSKEPIVQKIKKAYMVNNFEQYDVAVELFNKGGENILKREADERLDGYRFRYMNSDYATSHLNLFYIKDNEIGGENRFYAFINLYDKSAYIGAVVIELVQQRIQSGSVFPRLLMDSKYSEMQNLGQFDYAIFRDGKLQFSMGNFNYRRDDFQNIYDQSGLFTTGFTLNGYHHLAVERDNEVVVISSPAYPNKYVLADVALFFVSYLLLTLFFILIYSLAFGISKFRFNYATKLQFYLNFAFFVPMLIISVVTVGLLSNLYTEDLHSQYFEKATIIRDNLSSFHENQPEIRMDQEEFSNEVYQLAGNTNTDINLYTPSGRLVATNQPTIFEKKILSDYINPKAYAHILELQNNHFILDEKIGALNYKTVYLALREKEEQEVIGIIALPFFESETELNEVIVDVFSNILNIFVLIFIAFLIISYFVSKRLTKPFKLLTQKIKATNLQNNEPMNWPAHDEIGMLVTEYNNMLYKLEASMKTLATKEKESAWREMAKQVAHEIKNPLTPMKLTLQHMLRLKSEGKLDDPEALKKPVQTLINQVDILSDIATSFSTFAKMPLPENNLMDFRSVVREAVELFLNSERAEVCYNDETESELLIMGDPKLFGRVISNLIINGIQAVEKDQPAVIKVELSQKKNRVQLKITDNGKGVDEDLRDKIFMPNFSTKSEGSGLGLAIAKRGVETAGGKIWFQSKTGVGTSFFLSFPLFQSSTDWVILE